MVLDRDNNRRVGDFNLVHIINSLDGDWVRTQMQNAISASVPVIVSELPFHNFECRKIREEFSKALIDYTESGQAFCCPNFLSIPDISLHRYVEFDASIKEAKALILYGFDSSHPPHIGDDLCKELHVINLGIFEDLVAGKNETIATETAKSEFTKNFGAKDFVLCVADFAPHNNQLMLLLALEHLNLPLVLISRQSKHASRYAKAVSSFHRNSITRIIELADDDTILKALLAARVHALIAWNEPVDAMNLHAVMKGCNVVASKNTALSHMLQGNGVYYCNQGDKNAINNAINAAYYAPMPQNAFLNLAPNKIPTWQETIEQTLQVYKNVLFR